MAEPVKLRKWEGPPKKVRAKQEYVPTEASREAEDNIREMLRKPGHSLDIKATLDFQIDEVRRPRARHPAAATRRDAPRRENGSPTSATSPTSRDRSRSRRARRRFAARRGGLCGPRGLRRPRAGFTRPRGAARRRRRQAEAGVSLGVSRDGPRALIPLPRKSAIMAS